jgi:hypothetical protein
MVFRLTTKDNKRLSIKQGDLRKLVFWAHVGTGYAYGGSHAKTIPKIIVKEMKRLNLKPYHFSCFNNPPDKRKLSNDVLEEYRMTLQKEGREA